MKRLHTHYALSALSISLSLSVMHTAAAEDDPEGRVAYVNDVVAERMETENGNIRVVQVAEGLKHPWAVAWLPDGRMLVSERPGNLLLIGEGSVTNLGNLPKIDAEEDQKTAPEGGNQGGLLDVVLHPDYEDNGWIYFTYSSPGDNDGVAWEDYATGTALACARLNDDETELTDVETLYAENPRKEPGRHYGSRIIFPGDGSLIFSIGDRGIRSPSQDLTDPAGSMIRLYEDGGAHEDNPFVAKAPGNLRPEIYSFGHRNNQALAIQPGSDAIWTAEHGPYGGDLLHKVEKGNNYGWPMIARGKEYATEAMMGLGKTPPGVEEPVYVWEESMAPSGMTFYDGDSYPGWNGNLFVGSLYRQQLHRLVLDGDEVSHREVLLDDTVGRIRDVRQGPDGYLYVVTDQSDGGVYRIEFVQ
jgi:aldose sugar dehydrogenase